MADTKPRTDDANSKDSSTSKPEDEVTKQQLDLAVSAQTRREQMAEKKEENANSTATDPTLSFAEKIDRLARTRGWFGSNVDKSVIDSYLTRSISIDAAVEKLAATIDHLYTTANEGRAHYDAEMAARNQRGFHTPEKSLEQWGAEQYFPRPRKLPKGEYHPSCESHLWNLWYGFLHVAKRIDWNHADQDRFVELMKALKARPDPPPPELMTIPLKRDWIWAGGTVWSRLLLLGPSARESWNDSPGGGAGWTDVEVEAFANVNAFIARVTAAQVADFKLYGIWAVRGALEDEVTGQEFRRGGDFSTQMESHVMLAFVWVKLAGQYLWDRKVEDEPGHEDVALTMRGNNLPWAKGKKDEVSNAR